MREEKVLGGQDLTTRRDDLDDAFFERQGENPEAGKEIRCIVA